MDHRDHVLRICRAVMPGVAGVVLASEEGSVVGHEAAVADAPRIASAGLHARQEAMRLDPAAGASTLVRGDAGLYLVVFVPPAIAQEWSIATVGSLPIAA